MFNPKSLYVLGFMFTPDKKQVLLIRRKKNDWQRQRFNGIGGHINLREPDWKAIIREFEEETGICTVSDDWTHAGTFVDEAGNSQVEVFSGILPTTWMTQWNPHTDEGDTDLLSVNDVSAKNSIENLPLLISLCMARDTLNLRTFTLRFGSAKRTPLEG